MESENSFTEGNFLLTLLLIFFTTDIDECKDGTANCSENLLCENYEGGYRCITPKRKVYITVSLGMPNVFYTKIESNYLAT